jgi:hypothetical protein
MQRAITRQDTMLLNSFLVNGDDTLGCADGGEKDGGKNVLLSTIKYMYVIHSDLLDACNNSFYVMKCSKSVPLLEFGRPQS